MFHQILVFFFILDCNLKNYVFMQTAKSFRKLYTIASFFWFQYAKLVHVPSYYLNSRLGRGESCFNGTIYDNGAALAREIILGWTGYLTYAKGSEIKAVDSNREREKKKKIFFQSDKSRFKFSVHHDYFMILQKE